MPPGYIFGLSLSKGAGLTSKCVQVFPGICRDQSDETDISIPATLVKNLDQSWAAGGGAGGLDTGTLQANAGYHVFAIDGDDGPDALISASATNPVMPIGYEYKRRLGGIITDSNKNVRPFIQNGDYFALEVPISLGWGDFSGGAFISKLLPVPLGVKLRAEIFLTTKASTAGYVSMRDPDACTTDLVNSAIFYQNADNVISAGAVANVWTDTTGHVLVGGQQTTPITSAVLFRGWEDLRDAA